MYDFPENPKPKISLPMKGNGEVKAEEAGGNLLISFSQYLMFSWQI